LLGACCRGLVRGCTGESSLPAAECSRSLFADAAACAGFAARCCERLGRGAGCAARVAGGAPSGAGAAGWIAAGDGGCTAFWGPAGTARGATSGAVTTGRGALGSGLVLHTTAAITDAVMIGSANQGASEEPAAAPVAVPADTSDSAQGGVGAPASTRATCLVSALSKS
jgi:hypothetical protein